MRFDDPPRTLPYGKRAPPGRQLLIEPALKDLPYDSGSSRDERLRGRHRSDLRVVVVVVDSRLRRAPGCTEHCRSAATGIGIDRWNPAISGRRGRAARPGYALGQHVAGFDARRQLLDDGPFNVFVLPPDVASDDFHADCAGFEHVSRSTVTQLPSATSGLLLCTLSHRTAGSEHQ